MGFDWNVGGRDALLKTMYVDKDLPAEEVAKMIGHGCTANAVRGRAARQGLGKIESGTKRMARSDLKDAIPIPIYPVGPKAAVLADIGDGCRFPVGPLPAPGNMYLQLMCGETRQDGSSYCSHHARIADPPKGKRQ